MCYVFYIVAKIQKNAVARKKRPDFAANNIGTALDHVGLQGKSLPFYVIPVGIYKREGFFVAQLGLEPRFKV